MDNGSAFSRLPTEITEHLARFLKPADLDAFRLTCVQANVQTLEVMAERFSSLRTSLVGEDCEKLEGIAANPAFGKHVKVVCIEDGFERDEETPPPRTSHVWPRDDRTMIKSQTLSVAGLRHLLANNVIRPETIVIRDYRDHWTSVGAEPAAALMREITDGISLAVLSIELNQLSSIAAEIVLQLSPEHQGQDMGTTLLRSAHLCRNENMTTYWSERIFYDSPALEDLKLSFFQNRMGRVIDAKVVEGALPTRPVQFRLKAFRLEGSTVAGPSIITMLRGSFDTLSRLSFIGTRLARPETWREVLSTIAQQCSMLTAVELTRLLEGGLSEPQKHIRFGSISVEDFAEQYRSGLDIQVRGPSNDRRIVRVVYQGSNACDMLRIFAAAIE